MPVALGCPRLLRLLEPNATGWVAYKSGHLYFSQSGAESLGPGCPCGWGRTLFYLQTSPRSLPQQKGLKSSLGPPF